MSLCRATCCEWSHYQAFNAGAMDDMGKGAHQPTVAIATPIARKSTNTAERIVNTECQGLLLNLQQMHNQDSAKKLLADAAVGYIHRGSSTQP